MATSPRTFKKSSVTYGEVIDVLKNLGYHLESDDKDHRFTNIEHNSIVVLPVCPSDEMLEYFYLETYSRRLYLQGVIEKEDGIQRIIEKNRLKKRKKTVNAEPVPA